MASKFKIEYTQEDLDALKKIFDANLYAKAYPDVAAAYGNDREALWNHYITHGIKEGRTQINSTFNVFAYIAAYPDLRNAFGDDLMAYYVHYANYGMNENRKLITVDAVTKAGYTITGINGQVIAVPKLEPAPVEEPDPVEEQETVQEPAPTQEPTTPIETPCKHQWTEDTCDICGTIHKEHTWTKHIVSGKDESTCTRKCDVSNHCAEHSTAYGVLRNERKPGGIPVQTVDAAEDKRTVLLRKIVGKSVGERVVVIVHGRMDRHSGRLMNHHQVLILINNIQRQIHRRNLF